MKELTIKKLRDFIDNINGDAKVCVRYPDGRVRSIVEKNRWSLSFDGF